MSRLTNIDRLLFAASKKPDGLTAYDIVREIEYSDWKIDINSLRANLSQLNRRGFLKVTHDKHGCEACGCARKLYLVTELATDHLERKGLI